MAEKEYYSFEEVLRDLKLEEDELKRLVSAGEIRAFRDKNTMRFKAEDVDRLRGEEGGADLELDELELELEDDVKPAAPPRAATREVEELTLETSAPGEEIELEQSASAETVEEVDLSAQSDAATQPKARPARGGAGGAGGAAARRAARAPVEEGEEASEGVGVIAMLIVGALLLICTTFVVLDAVLGHTSNPLTKAVSGLFS